MSLNKFKFNLWPDAKTKAFTLSYDDGVVDDRRFIEMIDAHKLKATFHVNSGGWGQGNRLNESEVKELYKNHELSVHTVTHPMIECFPDSLQRWEVLEDRRQLEALVGYPIRGMSYPFGSYSPVLLDILKSSGIKYSRTVHSTKSYDIPKNFLEWHPTCHHKDALECVDGFLSEGKWGRPTLFYVWGHSYEFPKDNNWELIDQLADKVANRDDTWYATNIEIYDYVTATQRLEFAMEGKSVYNPSACDVWITHDEDPICIKSGEVTLFE